MIGPARQAALAALRAVNTGSVDLPTALSQHRDRLKDARDRALTGEIVTGTLRWRAALDHVIAHISGRPLSDINPEIVDILRLSLYQILYLTRVPASAVVDDAVNLAREVERPSATGFVNAVLRSTLRQRNRLPLPTPPTTPTDHAAALAYLSITLSHPAWLVERWLARVGFDATERWLRFNNSTPSPTLRANRLRGNRDELAAALDRDDVETRPCHWAPDGLVVTAGHAFESDARTRFIVQDEASQLVPLVVAPQPHERVLDLCAAPGGKTTALAAAMGDTGQLIACDVRPRRMRLLRETVAGSGATHVSLVQIARDGALPFTPTFDRVLVDAPCSGLGTIRRDPDIKWRRTATDLQEFAVTQHDLLSRAARVVRPGGRLVYATCSSEPEENEHVVARFLAGHPEFRRLDSRSEVDPALYPLFDADGCLHTVPATHELEAFFAAALVRGTSPS